METQKSPATLKISVKADCCDTFLTFFGGAQAKSVDPMGYLRTGVGDLGKFRGNQDHSSLT